MRADLEECCLVHRSSVIKSYEDDQQYPCGILTVRSTHKAVAYLPRCFHEPMSDGKIKIRFISQVTVDANTFLVYHSSDTSTKANQVRRLSAKCVSRVVAPAWWF